MKQRNRLIAFIIALAFVAGCTGLRMSRSQDEIYYTALGIWYDAGSQFRFYYGKCKDEELKAKWDEEFRPKLIKAKEILNLWSFHLQNGQAVSGDLESWKPIKNELIYYIATQMKKEDT